MIPILNRKCPKCGFLTLAKSGKYEYCMSSKLCDYSDKPIIKATYTDISKEVTRYFEEEKFDAYNLELGRDCYITKAEAKEFYQALTEEDLI